MKILRLIKNMFQNKYFKFVTSVSFVVMASIFTGYLIANGANYLSATFLNIDNGGAYISGKVGIGTAAPNTQLHVNAPAGADVFRVQTAGTTKWFVDDTGFIGAGGFFTPSSALEVSGNIETDSILNRNQRSLLTTEYINSDVNGNQVWSNDVLTIDDETDNGGWYWATNQFMILPSPALGFRLRGSSDDGGVCQIVVDNMFAANITNVGYTPAYTLDGSIFPAGGSYSNSGSGGMSLNNTFLLDNLQSGVNYNMLGQSLIDNWGYIKPVGLKIIPAGRSVRLRGGRNDGASGEFIRCYLDVLYATEYKPL